MRVDRCTMLSLERDDVDVVPPRRETLVLITAFTSAARWMPSSSCRMRLRITFFTGLLRYVGDGAGVSVGTVSVGEAAGEVPGSVDGETGGFSAVGEGHGEVVGSGEGVTDGDAETVGVGVEDTEGQGLGLAELGPGEGVEQSTDGEGDGASVGVASGELVGAASGHPPGPVAMSTFFRSRPLACRPA